MESSSDIKSAKEGVAAESRPITLNRPYAFAMASISALILAVVGLLGQLAARELSVFPALFLRYLVATLVILFVLRGGALQTLGKIGRLDWLRVGSVLISQFCLFYYLYHGSLLIGMLLYNTGPLFSAILARLLLGITFGARTVVSLTLGFAGVALVLNPFGERLDGAALVALPTGPVVANAARLAAAFRSESLPVVLVRVAFSTDEADRLRLRVANARPIVPLPPDYAQLEAALDRQPKDIIVIKRQWGAF
jgi:drug/metabolite transporter (DMT)-like permease